MNETSFRGFYSKLINLKVREEKRGCVACNMIFDLKIMIIGFDWELLGFCALHYVFYMRCAFIDQRRANSTHSHPNFRYHLTQPHQSFLHHSRHSELPIPSHSSHLSIRLRHSWIAFHALYSDVPCID